jgi:CDP-diacylglycerol--glycerol-3-phosphate 3-phosphatidyltransferase
VNTVTMWIAVILTVASGIDYIVSEVRARRASAGEGRRGA